jgi:VanZ family protein
LFVPLLVIVLVLALMPSPPSATALVNDKVEHVAAFLALGLIGLLGWPRRATAMLIFLLAVGAGIELLQGTSFIGRDRDFFDWLADAAGLACGSALAYPVTSKVDRA